MFVKRFPLVFPYKNVIFRLALQRTSRYTGSMLIFKVFQSDFQRKARMPHAADKERHCQKQVYRRQRAKKNRYPPLTYRQAAHPIKDAPSVKSPGMN